MIGAQGTAIHINYRTCNGGTSGHTPTTWFWRAGSSSNWSNHSFGNVNTYGYISSTGQISTTTANGFKIDSGTAAYLTLDSGNSWSYIQYLYNGANKWDVGSYQGGRYEIRPNGGSSNRFMYYHDGHVQLEASDAYIIGGTVTSRAGSRAIEVGYADKSCYISASRTNSNISMILIGGTSNQNYIFNRASATDTSGRTMVVTRGNTNAFLMNGGSGYVTFYGGHGNSSDRLLKKNIEDSNYGLEAVNNLKPRRFFWKDETVSKQKQIGFIAQE